MSKSIYWYGSKYYIKQISIDFPYQTVCWWFHLKINYRTVQFKRYYVQTTRLIDEIHQSEWNIKVILPASTKKNTT